jgi:hypothetical protein
MLKLGQLAYTFEKTLLGKITFPHELGKRVPQTFARLDELLKQDWAKWNKKDQKRQKKLIQEQHKIQQQFIALKQDLSEEHFEALRQLKSTREEFAHPHIDLVQDLDFENMCELIEEEMPEFVLEEAKTIALRLRDMQLKAV